MSTVECNTCGEVYDVIDWDDCRTALDWPSPETFVCRCGECIITRPEEEAETC